MTLPSGNLLILEGDYESSGVAISSVNPTWQVLNVATTALSFTKTLPDTAFAVQTPYTLYPLTFILPHTGSLLVIAHPHTLQACHATCRCVCRREH